jgi:hypothetical protein
MSRAEDLATAMESDAGEELPAGFTFASAIPVAQTLSLPCRQSCRHALFGAGEPCVPKKRTACWRLSGACSTCGLSGRQLFSSISPWANMGQAAMATVASIAPLATWNPQVAGRIVADRVRIPPSPPAYFL